MPRSLLVPRELIRASEACSVGASWKITSERPLMFCHMLPTATRVSYHSRQQQQIVIVSGDSYLNIEFCTKTTILPSSLTPPRSQFAP